MFSRSPFLFRLALATMTSVAFLPRAYARLGDTRPQCDERYGEAYKVEKNASHYRNADFFLTITFSNGTADSIAYQRVTEHSAGQNEEISEAEIENLLKVNGGGRTWTKKFPPSVDIQWVSNDGELSASYYKARRYLTVYTKAWFHREASKRRHVHRQPVCFNCRSPQEEGVSHWGWYTCWHCGALIHPGQEPTQDVTRARKDISSGVVTLYYATDRLWTGSKEQPKWFGDDWNEKAGHLVYGQCEVSIPLKKHNAGEVEKPAWYRLEFSEDPAKHVVVYRPRQLAEKAFFDGLAEAVRERDEKEIVIFIHGFNNTFDDAASRLGVLAFDMELAGVPVLYSWCSRGETLSYAHDEEASKSTTRPLADFLAAVAQTGRAAGARRINVVAHSMGNRPLVAAMQALTARTEGQVLFEEVVMAAPDVPAMGFATDEWPLMRRNLAPAKRVTLYASSDDKALKASKKVHGYRRIGEAGDGLLLLPGLDTIDATGCDFSRLGLNHAYFGGPRVLADLRTLFSEGLAPAERKLREMKRQELPYWVLPGVAPR